MPGFIPHFIFRHLISSKTKWHRKSAHRSSQVQLILSSLLALTASWDMCRSVRLRPSPFSRSAVRSPPESLVLSGSSKSKPDTEHRRYRHVVTNLLYSNHTVLQLPSCRHRDILRHQWQRKAAPALLSEPNGAHKPQYNT